MDLSCEITRTCARVFHLTTGTFNLIVKDRIAFRLSGAPSVQNGLTPMRIRLSSKPFNLIAQSCCCQPIVPTGFPPVFHNRGAATTRSADNHAQPQELVQSATKRLFRLQLGLFRHKPKRKIINLRKDQLEVLATTAKPFEEPCPRMKSRGRDQFQSFNLWSTTLDAGHLREFQKSCPASHALLSTNSVIPSTSPPRKRSIKKVT